MTDFSRLHPGPRYRELLALYARMHAEGEALLGIPGDRTFPGQSLFGHVGRIKRLIQATGAKTVLDYGAGKGLQYRSQRIVVDGEHVADSIAEYWDVDHVQCYDPAYAPYSALPEGKFDGVVCTDVLEHCAAEDLSWILGEIFSCARKFVYLMVACQPALKCLPNGENAHVTVRPPQWWEALVRQAGAGHAGLPWELHTEQMVDGRLVEHAFSR
jgi:hypothetical protein